LGGVTGEAGRFEEAAAHLDDALNLHRAAHDHTGQARTHAELAALAHVRGVGVAARRHESAAAARGDAEAPATATTTVTAIGLGEVPYHALDPPLTAEVRHTSARHPPPEVLRLRTDL
ncbi:hypothetical protein ACFVZX_25875, partial [Streptomyces erythrochromogenes]